MPSLSSRLLLALLQVTQRKRIYSSVQQVLDGIGHVRQQGPARPSARLQQRLLVQHQHLDGIEVYHLAPRTKPARSAQVLYLHGGAYIRPITVHHWRFLQALVERTGCSVTVPLYPLAPEASGEQAVNAALAVYQQACAAAKVDAPHVMGDSAGGGLALALSFKLREQRAPLPRSLTLICPWLDVSMQHPDIARTEPHDPMLASIGLQEAGRLYAGSLGVGHPLISPLHGELSGLPPTLLLAGTRDIAHHDALLFATKARAAGVKVELVIGEGMVHVWPILPIAEGRQALKTIAAFLNT